MPAEIEVSLAANLGLASINLRDQYTGFHCLRVMWLCGKLLNQYLITFKKRHKEKYKTFVKSFGEHLKMEHSEKRRATYYYTPTLTFASKVHDLGKIAWPDDLLCTDKPINDQNRSIQQMHPLNAARIFYRTLSKMNVPDEKLGWIVIVLFHHWSYKNSNNNNRYPLAIECKHLKPFIKNHNYLMPKNEDTMDENIFRIMIGIIRLSDELDARTTYRSYRAGETMDDYSTYKNWKNKIWKKVKNNILANSDSRFHPDVLTVFKTLADRIKEDLFDMKNSSEDNPACLFLCLKDIRCSQEKDSTPLVLPN